MSSWQVLVFGLGAASAFAVSANLKHLSAVDVPEAQDMSARSMGQLAGATLRHRAWLAAIAADVAGVGLQTLALRVGALAVVQPLLISGLVITLLLRRQFGGTVRRQEVLWGVVVSLALSGFLLIGGSAATVGTNPADRVPAVAAAAVGILFTAACLTVARRLRGRAQAAAALGAALGAVDAGAAALLKSLTGIANHGTLAVVASWELYAALGLGAVALLLNQLAFQAGPISASLPAISTVGPLLSIVIGVAVYDERIRHGPVALTGLAILLSVLGVAIVALTRIDPTRAAPAPV